jgi:hypothetical protein
MAIDEKGLAVFRGLSLILEVYKKSIEWQQQV